jgi:hypothetical protein
MLKGALGTSYEDPAIPRWITENFRHLSQAQADLVSQVKEITNEFSYHIL